VHHCGDQSTVHCTSACRVANLLLPEHSAIGNIESIPKLIVDLHVVLTKGVWRLYWRVEVGQWVVFDETDGRVDEDDC